MLKDNVTLRYVPSLMTVLFTGNVGPEGYTELSPQIYADVRVYGDVVLASASFKPAILCGVLGIALVLGALAEFFVPALPFDIPRRGFGLFSWVAVLYGQELGGELGQDDVNRHTDLNDLEETLGEKRVYFITS